jgi:hypothetical protein
MNHIGPAGVGEVDMPAHRRMLVPHLAPMIVAALLTSCGRAHSASVMAAPPTPTSYSTSPTASASPTSDATPVHSGVFTAQPRMVTVSPMPPGPTPTPQPTPTEQPGGSGVDGSLGWSPPCRNATPPCEAASRLLDGEVWAQQGGTTIARTHTSRWRFVLTLAPGGYTLHAKPDDPNYPSCTPVNVSVPPGKYVDMSFDCQSRTG